MYTEYRTSRLKSRIPKNRIMDRRSGWIEVHDWAGRVEHREHYHLGQLHYENGPAVIDKSGTQRYYINGKRHRIGGPAIIYANGTEVWYENNKRHREDGPAVYRPHGSSEFWMRGKRLWK